MAILTDIPSTAPIFQRLFSPIQAGISTSKHARRCNALSDQDWVEAGVRRTMSQERSGRGFLDLWEDRNGKRVRVSAFFESLKSSRRKTLLQDTCADVYRKVCNTVHGRDPFAHIEALSDFDIYAGDGHYLEHAVHDPRDLEGKESVWATGHFFGFNLRNQGLFHLTDVLLSETAKREHDMHALKRLPVDILRQGATVGRKVLWVWDRAGIDARQWVQWKMRSGIYFISRTKTNMKLEKMADLSYDTTSDVNKGVTSFELVSVASQALRCVSYTCPDSNGSYQFITTLTTVEPGVIAALYKARWDIEKTFDVTKCKLGEAKSWASSATAKHIHANFITLTYNALLLFEYELEQPSDDGDGGVVNVRENKRREKRIAKQVDAASKLGRHFSQLVLAITRRCSQRTLTFIRWIRNCLDEITPWSDLVERLRRRYGQV